VAKRKVPSETNPYEKAMKNTMKTKCQNHLGKKDKMLITMWGLWLTLHGECSQAKGTHFSPLAFVISQSFAAFTDAPHL